jgi:uncharacterized membrane protein YjjB (DUF3815 family)
VDVGAIVGNCVGMFCMRELKNHPTVAILVGIIDFIPFPPSSL